MISTRLINREVGTLSNEFDIYLIRREVLLARFILHVLAYVTQRRKQSIHMAGRFMISQYSLHRNVHALAMNCHRFFLY